MCYIFQAHLHHGPPPNSDQNPAVTHAPLVLAIIIPKPFFFSFAGLRVADQNGYSALSSRCLASSTSPYCTIGRFWHRLLENCHSIDSFPIASLLFKLVRAICLFIPLLCISERHSPPLQP